MSQFVEEQIMVTLNSRFLFNFKQPSITALGTEDQIKIYKFLFLLYDDSWTWIPQAQKSKSDVPYSTALKYDSVKIQFYLKRMDLGHLATKPDDVVAAAKIGRILQAMIDKLDARFHKGLRERIMKLHKKELLSTAKAVTEKIPSAPKTDQNVADCLVNNVNLYEQRNVIPRGKQIPRTPIKMPDNGANSAMNGLATDVPQHVPRESELLNSTYVVVPPDHELDRKPEDVAQSGKKNDQSHQEEVIPTVKLTTQELTENPTGYMNSTFTMESAVSIPPEPVLLPAKRGRNPSPNTRELDAIATKSLTEENPVVEDVNSGISGQHTVPSALAMAEADDVAKKSIKDRKHKTKRIEILDEMQPQQSDLPVGRNGQNGDSDSGKDSDVMEVKSKSTRRAKVVLQRGKPTTETARVDRKTDGEDGALYDLAVRADRQSQEISNEDASHANEGQSCGTRRGKRTPPKGKPATGVDESNGHHRKKKTDNKDDAVDDVISENNGNIVEGKPKNTRRAKSPLPKEKLPAEAGQGSLNMDNVEGIVNGLAGTEDQQSHEIVMRNDEEIGEGRPKSTRKAKSPLPKGKLPTEAVHGGRNKSKGYREDDLVSKDDRGGQDVANQNEGNAKEDKFRSATNSKAALQKENPPTEAAQDNLNKVLHEDKVGVVYGDVMDGNLATKTTKRKAKAAQPKEDVSNAESHEVPRPKASKKAERTGNRKASQATADEERDAMAIGVTESADAVEDIQRKVRAKRKADVTSGKPAISITQKKAKSAEEVESSQEKPRDEAGKKTGHKGTRKPTTVPEQQGEQREDVSQAENAKVEGATENLSADANEKENMPSKKKAQKSAVKQKTVVGAVEMLTNQTNAYDPACSEEPIPAKRTLRSRKQVNYRED